MTKFFNVWRYILKRLKRTITIQKSDLIFFMYFPIE